MTFELFPQYASLGIVDIDLCIVASSQDLFTVKQQARDDMSVMRAKCDMLWLAILHHPCFAYEVMALVK